MKRVIAVIFLMLLADINEALAMELNTALKLINDWGRDSKDMTLIGQLTVDASGGFLTKSAGAFLRYDPAKKTLLVSGLVRYDDELHSEFPDTWEKLVRASRREWATLGEGYLELYTKKLFNFRPNVVLLTKEFKDDAIKPAQFVVQVDWLLSSAYYWNMKRYNEVLVTSEDKLIVQGPIINDEMLKQRPRPW